MHDIQVQSSTEGRFAGSAELRDLKPDIGRPLVAVCCCAKMGWREPREPMTWL